jgi:hypothetical protein
MTVSRHTVAGTVVTIPVRIRRATQYTAMFSVDAGAAQRMIDYSGLEVCRYVPGRAIVVLMLMHYLDGDLGQYHEFGTNVMVNPPGSKASGPRALQSAGAFVHHLPVDQAFTLEAGQVIWGYPKVMADFTVRAGNPLGFDVHIDGQLVASMDFQAGLPIPAASLPATQVCRTYSHRDGVTRETVGESSVTGMRARPGGVRLRLGDHFYADELRTLGLPKRAFITQSSANVAMTFGDARDIT